MKRKIIKLGQATYVLSLPSPWIRENQLEKGDYLEVEEEEGTLRLSPPRVKKGKTIQLDIRKLADKLANGNLVMAYSAGYDTIEVLHEPTIDVYTYPSTEEKKQRTTEFLQFIVHNKLTGMEIVEQSDRRTIIKDLGAGVSEESAQNVFQRLLFLLTNQVKEVEKVLVNGNAEQLRSLSPTFLNIRRFLLYYTRLISLTPQSKNELRIRMSLITHFNRLNSSYKSMVNLSLKRKKIIFSKPALRALQLMNVHLEEVRNLCLDFTYEKSIRFLNNREVMWNQLLEEKHLQQMQPHDYPITWAIGAVMGSLWFIVNELNALHLEKK